MEGHTGEGLDNIMHIMIILVAPFSVSCSDKLQVATAWDIKDSGLYQSMGDGCVLLMSRVQAQLQATKSQLSTCEAQLGEVRKEATTSESALVAAQQQWSHKEQDLLDKVLQLEEQIQDMTARYD